DRNDGRNRCDRRRGSDVRRPAEHHRRVRLGPPPVGPNALRRDAGGRSLGATSFRHRTGPHFRCLGQRPGTTRIYACADMILDGFSVGTSDDGAMTFQHVLKFTELKGPLTCPEVQTACAAHWARIQQVLGLTGADAGVTPPPDAGSSAGPATKSCASAPDGPQ